MTVALLEGCVLICSNLINHSNIVELILVELLE